MGYQRFILVADTYTDAARANLNFSTSEWALFGTGYEYFAVITSPLPIRSGSTLTLGRLSLFSGRGMAAGTYTVTVTPTSGGWWVSKVTTAHNRPTLVTAAALTRTVVQPSATVQAHRWDVDIAPILQAMVDGAGYNGLRVTITGPTSANGAQFYTTRSTVKPYLDVEWADVPERPTQVSPSAGRYVGVAAPLFRVNFNDFGGTTRCSGMQVVVSTSPSMSPVEWDSGQVATGLPQLDSAALGYGGVPLDGLRYWRARVQNQAGTWSDWSPTESFRYYPLPVPVMDSPAGPTVEDATPPVLFHAASGDPALWQVAVYDHLSGRVLWAREWAPMSAPLAVTVGQGAITNGTTRYRVAVQVRDSRNREAIPGTPTYGEAARVVTYQPGATANPTALTAAQTVKGRPEVRLTWSRSAAPDAFTILRGGEVIAVVPSTLVFQGGTEYEWVDRGVPPSTPLEYTVRATVNGVAGPGASVSLDALHVVGIWITDPAGELDPVTVWGEDQGTWNLAEESEWLTPLGARASVLITGAQRGYEGAISGELLDRASPLPAVTSRAMRARFLAFRDRPGRVVNLVAQDTAIRAVLARMNVEPTPQRGLTYAVAFEFRQVG